MCFQNVFQALRRAILSLFEGSYYLDRKGLGRPSNRFGEGGGQ